MASLGSAPEYMFPTDDSNSNPLGIAGFQMDAILKLGDSLRETEYFKTPASNILQHWQSLATEISEDPVEFWVTIITDRTGGGIRLTETQRTHFGQIMLRWLVSKSDKWPTVDFRRLMSFHTPLRFFVSVAGLMGMAPDEAQVGDIICVLFGGQVLFILRKREPTGYILIGECYVHGVMDGEAMKGYEEGKYSKEFFHVY